MGLFTSFSKNIALIVGLLVGSVFAGNKESMICQSYELSMYGFYGEENEAVCANILDYTDFIIVSDYEMGDILQVKFNGDDVVSIKALDKDKVSKLIKSGM